MASKNKENVDTKELKKIIEESAEERKNAKPKKHIFVNFFLIILLIVSLGYFTLSILNQETSVMGLIKDLLLTIFVILFVIISITYNRRSKKGIFISSLLLLMYILIGINNSTNLINTPISEVKDFQNKNIVDVMKWASKNNVTINQEYEFSDMIGEYKVINQDVKSGTELSKVKEINVSVSQGPNPDKEIMIPNMVTWDDERVINFVKDNYLSNVSVEFVSSDKAKDTVIEQNTSGNLKRSDELKLVFSYGEELDFEEVKLIDFTNKTKFEVEFYMKQHQLKYEFNEDFSKSIKKGNAMKQSIEPSNTVHINSDVITITISKGPRIKVPDLINKDLEDVTKWAIKNKLKLSFIVKYDDSIKENRVISCEKEKGSIVEQGSVIKLVLSRGTLKMPSFKSLNDFYEWADKYEIKYEEKHEFSNKYKAGEIIKFSYKKGEAIKNNDTIIVTISDGEKISVPSLIGLSKSEAISKLKKADLKYSFIYRSSDKTKDKVIDQSLKAGSEISKNISITVTLSNGKKEVEENKKVEERKTTASTRTYNKTNNNTYKPAPTNNTPKPSTPTCNSCNISGIKAIIRNNEGYQNIANALSSSIKSQCPGIKVNISGDSTSGKVAGSFISGFSGGATTSCSTVSIVLAR